MKKRIFGLGLAICLAGCSSVGIISTDPKVMACRKGCDTASEQCEKNAAGNQVQIAACKASSNKCVDQCSK